MIDKADISIIDRYIAEIIMAIRKLTIVMIKGLVKILAKYWISMQHRYAATAMPILIPMMPRNVKKTLMPSVILNLTMLSLINPKAL